MSIKVFWNTIIVRACSQCPGLNKKTNECLNPRYRIKKDVGDRFKIPLWCPYLVDSLQDIVIFSAFDGVPMFAYTGERPEGKVFCANCMKREC